MQQGALEKGERKLRRATAAVTAMRAAASFNDFADAWDDFVIGFNGVYAALEQGAKKTQVATGWFARKQGERKADQLLQYLQQARNADQHGIAPLVSHKPGRIAIGVNKPGYSQSLYLKSLKVGPAGVEFDATSNDGKPVLLEVTPSTAILVQVTNRGNTFEPPALHQGLDVAGKGPTEVGTLALEYLTKLMEEARQL
jgi:hypothetical protein